MDTGIGLFDFLVEAELQHYYNPIRNDLKVLKTAQLKYVADEDLAQLGMSRPEQRRLKKYYNKYFSPNYLTKIKKLLGPGKKDDSQPALSSLTEESAHALQAETAQEHIIKMPSEHVIPTENIAINKELGVGEFGVVQQGVWTNDGLRIQVAVKCLSKEKMNTNSMEFLKEAAIMHSIDHKNIVRLYGVVLHMDSLMLVTELAPLRSLLECLKEVSLRTSFPVLTLCDFAFQICEGMSYLENKRLIHRDLAARNILVFSKNKVKISDFGLSRALGVGKNYYQTNINVNLKLPIAWCAPECISYLRFTSSSDVWAFAVTLWEMFSYGFQPWAGFSGCQILIAIDSPNFQRLEQPDCCPQQYYALMQKCWSHEPIKRPKFSELLLILPDCKPEQVQAASPFDIDSNSKRSDQLMYRVGDVITILNKEHSSSLQWKGVLNNGTTGYFSPSNVVSLDSNSPPLAVNQTSTNSFNRVSIHEASGSGGSFRNSLSRTQGRFSTKRRLCTNMISGPQGDVKHTGHVGVDGVYFGDFPFFEHNLIPKQIVNPYKPSDDLEQTPLIHPNSPSHLTGGNATNPIKVAEFNKVSTDLDNNKHGAGAGSSHFNLNFDSLTKSKWPKNSLMVNNNPKSQNDVSNDFENDKDVEQPHEYQEIIDNQKISDFGQSLMEELDSIYNSHTRSNIPVPSNQDHDGTIHRNELTQISKRINNNSTLTKKKHGVMKPMSANDHNLLESAIAYVAKSMTDLEHKEQPLTPTTPNEKEGKFFRLPIGEHSGHQMQSQKTSNTMSRPEKRTFSQEVQSVPDIQSSLTEESRIAYESLVEQPVRLGTTLMGIREKQGKHHLDGSVRSLLRHDTVDAPHFHSSSELSLRRKECQTNECNPLPLPPKDKSVLSQTPRKRHTRIHPLIIQGSNLKRTMNRINAEISNEHTLISSVQNAHHYLNTDHFPKTTSNIEPVKKPIRNEMKKTEQTSHYQNVGIKLPVKDDDSFDRDSLKFEAQIEKSLTSKDCCDGTNADFEYETKIVNDPSSIEKQKIIPTTRDESVIDLNCVANLEYIDGDDAIFTKYENDDSKAKSNTFSKNGLPLPPVGDYSKLTIKSDLNEQDTKDIGSSSSLDEVKVTLKETAEQIPTSKTRSKSVDDDEVYLVDSEKDSMLARNRVSVEDLLKFADQKPCGRQRGTESDEVRIMCKVLNHQVSADTCLTTLEFVSWNVHRAIKLAELRISAGGELHECFAALNACSWDVSRAALLVGHGDITQV